MKISVIVPIYNVEKYIRRCLESLVSQTYKDLEIILVDDGSPDNSVKICEEFLNSDHRFKLISKENGGLSSARNVGLENATGDFIGFIDSDDYIEQDMYEYLVKICTETQSDIACCGISRIFTTSGKKFCSRSFDGVCVYSREEALYRFNLSDDISPAAWNKIFKREVVEGLEFGNYKRLEDSRFVCKAIMKANSVAFGSKLLYNYEIRGGSITRSGFNEKSYDILRVVDDNANDIASMDKVYENPIIGKIIWYTVFINEMLMRGGNDNFVVSQTQQMLKENWAIIKENADFSRIRIFQYGLLKNSYWLYKFFYKLYCGMSGK